MAQITRMREVGSTRKISGETYDGQSKMKTIVTEGFAIDTRGRKAILEETVPDYTLCDTCHKAIGKIEEKMSPYMVLCKHEKYNSHRKMACPDCGRIAVPEQMKIQEHICFDCFTDMTDNDSRWVPP